MPDEHKKLMVSLAEMAKLLDLTTRQVIYLGHQGVIPHTDKGKYDLVGCLHGYIHYLRDQKGDAVADRQKESIARLAQVKSELLEMDLKRMKGSLISVDEVEQGWAAIIANIRTGMMRIPDIAAPRIINASSIPEAREILNTIIRQVLFETANIEVVGTDKPARKKKSDHPVSGKKGSKKTKPTRKPYRKRVN